MRGKPFLYLLILCNSLLLYQGCSGGGASPTAQIPTSAPSGSVSVFAGDAPLCNVLSFSVTLTGGTLMPEGGGAPVSVIPSGQPVTVDFASLMGFMTELNLSNVPAGTYSQMTLTLSNPQMSVLDTTKTPMAPTPVNVTLSSATVTLNINPALQVASNNTLGLHLDFDLMNSIQTVAGNVTGSVAPVFQASPMPVAMGSLGEIDDLHGLVEAVNTSSTNALFSGSFSLQQGMMGRTFTVNVTGSTSFDGVSGLSALQSGTFVVADVTVDASGNLVAKEVNVENLTDMQQNMGAFVGTVMSVVRDAGGNATQFTMAVGEEYPNLQTMMPMMSSPTVNITSTTHFDVSAKDDNLASMTFGPDTMGVGQKVVVNGQIQMGGGMMGGTSGLTASSVVLTLQPVAGNFMNTLAVGSDGKTGGFTMMPCSQAFANQSMTMLTFAQTNFAGVNNLNAMTTTPMLANKGLLFYQPTPMQIGSVTMSSPGMVFVTKQVQQLH